MFPKFELGVPNLFGAMLLRLLLLSDREFEGTFELLSLSLIIGVAVVSKVAVGAIHFRLDLGGTFELLSLPVVSKVAVRAMPTSEVEAHPIPNRELMFFLFLWSDQRYLKIWILRKSSVERGMLRSGTKGCHHRHPLLHLHVPTVVEFMS
jgi:hypothetical protein